MIERQDIARSLEYGIRTGFLKGRQAYNPLRAPFVSEPASTGAFEDYADMGSPPWPMQGEGGLGAKGATPEGHGQITGDISAGNPVVVLGGTEQALRIYNVDWYITVGVKHNAINDGRVFDLAAWANTAGLNFEKHKDFLAFDALNRGASNYYGLVYDGKTLFADDHADPRGFYQTAQDNQYAVALSLDNYETIRVAGSSFKGDDGQPNRYDHRLLIHGPSLARVAAQITTNREDYATANRAANPYAGRVQSLEAPGGWLDTTAWFAVDPDNPQKPVLIQNRQAPVLRVWDDELGSSDGVRYFKWVSRYGVGYGDWRSIVQGNT